jgi:hypothetical protein
MKHKVIPHNYLLLELILANIIMLKIYQLLKGLELKAKVIMYKLKEITYQEA